MHLPLSAGAIEPPTKFSKKGEGLDRISILEGDCWKRKDDLFQGGGYCLHKIKSNLKYLMTKKAYKKMFLSVITKNLNCKILTKNLVIFKR